MNSLTSREKDLLTAAFAKHSGAWDAFVRWNQEIDWSGAIAPEIVSVLPMVCHNLRSLGYEDPLFPRFLGIDRKVWLENQTVKKNLMEWLPDPRKVEMLALPPTECLLNNAVRFPQYRSHLRFAVQSSCDAVPVIRWLLGQGWIPNDGLFLPVRWLDGFVWGMDHLGMHRNDGEWLSVTWRMETWFGSRWNEIWNSAERVPLGDRTLRVMGATDSMEFLMRQPIFGKPFRWVAQILMRNSELVDWVKLRNEFERSPLRPEALRLTRMLQEIVAVPILSESDKSEMDQRIDDKISSIPVGNNGGNNEGNGRRIWPLTPLRMAWRRYRNAWPDGTHWISALGQLPGYLIGRLQVRRHSRRRNRSFYPLPNRDS